MEEEPMDWDVEKKLVIMSSAAPENAKCNACARTSLESGEALYYTYSNGEKMIHKKCAQLPKRMNHPLHSEHPLVLLAKPPYISGTCECQVCQKNWKNFVYHCSSCEFDIDVLCAVLEDVDIMIPTHHHPVRLIRRLASFKCNACGVKREDCESYICIKPSCGFWIHKECGSLPEMFKRPDHDHPLLLAICMPDRYRKYKFTCECCHEDLGAKVWIYYCQRCKFFVHIKCIINIVREPRSISIITFGYPPRLAMIRQLKTITKQLASIKEEGHLIYLAQEGPRLPEVKVDSHKHSLLLDSDHHRDEDEIICDGCILPIDRTTSPYYKCGHYCNFFLHATCVTLPRHHVVLGYGHHVNKVSGKMDLWEVELYFPENPWGAVECFACHSFCNGYSYKCTKSGCNVYLDIKCCYLVGDISHIGHKHALVGDIYGRMDSLTCSCCGDSTRGYHYHCSTCSFRLGYECATLPASVNHRWDKHPLVLSFPPHFRDTDADEEFYCEVCEQEIHPKHWMYRCAECDQSFHPRCIPTLGASRNIKFGKTCSIKRHPHRLTLVPQAKLSSLCHTCRKLLYWSRAFECAPCGFYLCPDCIPKEELVVDTD